MRRAVSQISARCQIRTAGLVQPQLSTPSSTPRAGAVAVPEVAAPCRKQSVSKCLAAHPDHRRARRREHDRGQPWCIRLRMNPRDAAWRRPNISVSKRVRSAAKICGVGPFGCQPAPSGSSPGVAPSSTSAVAFCRPAADESASCGLERLRRPRHGRVSKGEQTASNPSQPTKRTAWTSRCWRRTALQHGSQRYVALPGRRLPRPVPVRRCAPLY